MNRLSRLLKNSLYNLYKQGVYTIDYCIIKAMELYEKNRLTQADFDELLDFFEKEQEKKMLADIDVGEPDTEAIEEAKSEQLDTDVNSEQVENTAEPVEVNTVEAETTIEEKGEEVE